jgi:hypothetical protein
LFEFGLPFPEDIAHPLFLPGPAAPGTCNSAENYWAATGKLLGTSVDLRLVRQKECADGSQTRPSVVT